MQTSCPASQACHCPCPGLADIQPSAPANLSAAGARAGVQSTQLCLCKHSLRKEAAGTERAGPGMPESHSHSEPAEPRRATQGPWRPRHSAALRDQGCGMQMPTAPMLFTQRPAQLTAWVSRGCTGSQDNPLPAGSCSPPGSTPGLVSIVLRGSPQSSVLLYFLSAQTTMQNYSSPYFFMAFSSLDCEGNTQKEEQCTPHTWVKGCHQWLP